MVEVQPVDWLVPGWLALGDVALIAGESEAGKSTFLAALAAQVAGGPSILGDCHSSPRSTLWWTAEERIDRQVVPRLRAARMPPGWCVMPGHQATGLLTQRLSLPSGMRVLSDVIFEEDARLVVLDPITSFLDGDVTGGGDTAVRHLIEQLQQVAQQRSCLVCFTRHDRKGRDGTSKERVGGSGAWTHTPRTIIRFQPHPEGKSRYIMTHDKGQVSGKCPSRIYTLPKRDGTPYFACGPQCDLGSDDLDDLPIGKIARSAVDEAVSLIKYGLAEGERSSEWMYLAAQKEGITVASMKRALARLKPTMSRKPHESTWKMWWSRPEAGWPED